MEYLKKAYKTAETNTQEAQKVVNDMLTNIEKHGEQAVRNYSAKLGNLSWIKELPLPDANLAFRQLHDDRMSSAKVILKPHL